MSDLRLYKACILLSTFQVLCALNVLKTVITGWSHVNTSVCFASIQNFSSLKWQWELCYYIWCLLNNSTKIIPCALHSIQSDVWHKHWHVPESKQHHCSNMFWVYRNMRGHISALLHIVSSIYSKQIISKAHCSVKSTFRQQLPICAMWPLTGQHTETRKHKHVLTESSNSTNVTRRCCGRACRPPTISIMQAV